MVDIKRFKQLALSFQGTEEKPHFERIAFKVIGQSGMILMYPETPSLIINSGH